MSYRRLLVGLSLLPSLISLWVPSKALADTVDAYCEFYRAGESDPEVAMPCRVYAAQGHVVVIWADGVESDFMLQFDQPGWVYEDQNGGTAYAEHNVPGPIDHFFHMENGSIAIYYQR